MPYALDGNCVVKKDTGEVVKCHDSRKEALAHLAALQMNVMEKEKNKASVDEWHDTMDAIVELAQDDK